ncbi:MAG: response regulator RpfG family c-di-GMP phosphodiesterase [Sulfurimonas sp.]|jgi:response regulator RpfG family c-di-GMP phosphodiesterase
MIYSGNILRDKYYENTQQEMKMQLSLTVERIEQYLTTLKRDMVFISHLDIMNDIYSKDVDRRISNLLEDKKQELNLDGNFHLLDITENIIATSDATLLYKKLDTAPMFLIDIKSEIDGSIIGKLALDFSLKNIINFFENSPERHYFIRLDKTKTLYKTDSFTNEIHVKQSLNTMKNTEIVLEQNQNVFLNSLKRYENIFILALIFGAIIISVIAFYFIDKLIKPLLNLSLIVEKITNTQDYSQRVPIHGEDEIATLADAFNQMLSGIDKALQENEILYREIEETQKEVVFTMGAIGESRSKETGNHVKRVAEYSKLLALSYGLSQEEADMIKQASPMHDIGKVAIPDAILNKPARFTPEEFEHMKKHAQLGYEMLHHSTRPLLQTAAVVANEHHEKWDGSGYPNGLAGKDIHIYGRITALADVFDALGSDRVYKKAWEDERIFELFREERGKHFDPDLIDIFFKDLDKFLSIRDTFKDS